VKLEMMAGISFLLACKVSKIVIGMPEYFF